MNNNEVLDKNKNLNEELIFILGRPNFTCGKIAERLRKKGLKCERKAEDEQALVIHTMLMFYERYADQWLGHFNKYVNEVDS